MTRTTGGFAAVVAVCLTALLPPAEAIALWVARNGDPGPLAQ